MDLTKITKNPILLTEENRRFAKDNTKEMHGYIKLETDEGKGLVIVTVDNVKFFPRGEYIYKLIFTGLKNEKRHYHMLGDISLTAYGSGEGSFRINTGNLNGRGMSLADYSTAIVAAMSTLNSREALHPVLKGDLDLCPESTVSETVTPRDYTPFYSSFVLQSCEKIENAQDKFEDIIPFDQDLTSARWKRITDLTLFPVISPGSVSPMKKYKHFLYGMGESHCFLGVPGRFFPEEQPDSGKSGFVFWQPITGMEKEARNKALSIEERRKNIYGYWIAAINRYNGHIEEIPLIEE